MTRKANAISTLARETMARIVGSPAEWEFRVLLEAVHKGD